MRFSLSDLPEGADVVSDGRIATVTVGDAVFRAEVSGDFLVLFPERSPMHRDFLVLMGRIGE